MALPVPSSTTEVIGCRHHWVIDTPSGPMSKGTCKSCGEVRVFKNYVETSYWDDDVPLDQVSSGARFLSTSSGYESEEEN
ncbi:MAG: hypothetical protein HYU29_04320 [Chloroflexi bacterium]|nr:hypothetical protein [Chloroflexota bacterium]